MNKFLIILCISTAFLTSCEDEVVSSSDVDGDGNWIRYSDFEGDVRTGAVSFVIGDFAYVGLGSDGDEYFKDFWRYDPSRNFWEEMASFPGAGRISAVAFSVEGKGYVGTGFNDDLDIEELDDFWEYDPSSNEWKEIASFGGSARYSAVAFSLGNQGYVGTGFDGSFLKDFWVYTPSNNQWSQTISLFGSKRESAFAFTVDGKAYVGSGINNGQFLYDFWAFDPEVESWEDLSITNDDNDDYDEFILAMERYDASVIVINDIAYISAGLGSSYLSSVVSYDPGRDRWIDGYTNFEGAPRAGAVGFTVNNQGYIATGRSASLRHDDIWGFRPDEDYEQFD